MPRGFAWIRVVRLASPLPTRDDHAFGTLHAEARDPQVKKHVRLFMNRSITLRFAVFLRKESQLRPLPHGFRKTKMAEGVRRQYSAARGALHEATLDQEGFDNVLDPIARLGQASGVAANYMHHTEISNNRLLNDAADRTVNPTR
jgi:hypothetical protein